MLKIPEVHSGPESTPSVSEHTHTCSFGHVVEPHLTRMFRSARQILPSDDLAWDAVQTTLIRLWRAEGLDEGAHVCGVLVRVVRLVSLEVLRGQRRRRDHETGAAQGEAGPDEVSDWVDRVAIEEQLGRLLAELPEDCREVAQRRVEHGDDYRRLADELKIPLGTVRSRLHRARRLLAARLEETSAA